MPEIRISWKDYENNLQGHGEKWFPASERNLLLGLIKKMDAEYPNISHWIEERDTE